MNGEDKFHLVLRISSIIVLLAIAGMILYFRFGTPPSLEEQKLLDKLNNPIIDCRGALVYYAEHELNYKADSNDTALINKYKMNFSIQGPVQLDKNETAFRETGKSISSNSSQT